MGRATRRAATALALAWTLALHASAAAVPPMDKARVFQDWAVACDNTRHCDAVGYQRAIDDEPLVMLHLSIDAGAGAALEAEMFALGDMPRSGKVRVMIDGQGYQGVGEGLLGSGMALRLVRSLKQQKTLKLWNDRMTWHLSLDGLREALQTIDEVQGRSGTVTALYSLGARLPDSVPEPLPAPLLRAAAIPPPRDSDAALLPAIVAALPGAGCDDGVPEADQERERAIHRLSASQVLVLLECESNGQQTEYAAWIADDQPPYTAVRQRPADAAGIAQARLFNADFQNGRLGSYAALHWPVDCGAYQRWLWTADGFQLLEAFDSPLCRGFPEGVDLRLWTATVR